VDKNYAQIGYEKIEKHPGNHYGVEVGDEERHFAQWDAALWEKMTAHWERKTLPTVKLSEHFSPHPQ